MMCGPNYPGFGDDPDDVSSSTHTKIGLSSYPLVEVPPRGCEVSCRTSRTARSLQGGKLLQILWVVAINNPLVEMDRISQCYVKQNVM